MPYSRLIRASLVGLVLSLQYLVSFDAAAGSPGHEWHLKRANKCVGCDLSHMRLTERKMSGALLRDANFNKSHLDYADLSKSDLRNSILSGASLRSISLRNADLRGAWMVNVNLNNADLRGANLEGATLGFSNFEGARLDGAIWTNGMICDTGSIGRCANPQPPKPVSLEADLPEQTETTGTDGDDG